MSSSLWSVESVIQRELPNPLLGIWLHKTTSIMEGTAHCFHWRKVALDMELPLLPSAAKSPSVDLTHCFIFPHGVPSTTVCAVIKKKKKRIVAMGLMFADSLIFYHVPH